MKHQTGKKQFLLGACHTVVVTLLLVRDHRALTWEDGALPSLGRLVLGEALLSVTRVNPFSSLTSASEGPVP